MCQRLLEKLSNQRDVLFIVNFMLGHLTDILSSEKKSELWLLHMGAKVLFYIDTAIYWLY